MRFAKDLSGYEKRILIVLVALTVLLSGVSVCLYFQHRVTLHLIEKIQ